MKCTQKADLWHIHLWQWTTNWSKIGAIMQVFFFISIVFSLFIILCFLKSDVRHICRNEWVSIHGWLSNWKIIVLHTFRCVWSQISLSLVACQCCSMVSPFTHFYENLYYNTIFTAWISSFLLLIFLLLLLLLVVFTLRLNISIVTQMSKWYALTFIRRTETEKSTSLFRFESHFFRCCRKTHSHTHTCSHAVHL